MDLRPLSHTQACVAVQWSDRLWSAQYRQRQAPLLRGRIRVGLANGGVDKHVSEARVRVERSEKKRAQTPAIVQRRNREGPMRQLPGSGGKSRHGDARRASHKIAPRNNRLSVPVLP